MSDTGGFRIFYPQTVMAAESELHEAAKADDVARINRLIKAGADVNAVDENGDTPLDIAKAHKK